MQRIFYQVNAQMKWRKLNSPLIFAFSRIDDFKPKTCYYRVLNVSSDAKFEDIKSSYLKLAKKYHPDANPDLIQSEKFKEISEAYNVLSHVEKRSQYDQINGLGSGWKYEQEGSSFTNDEQYEQVLKEEAEKKKKTDEQAFEYFDKKYFQNRDFFKKNTIDDNEFELTMKLYKEHKAEVTEKKKDYVEFFPFTSSHYYVHKDVEAKALEKNQVESVILDFKVPILIIAFAMIGTGIYSGVGVKEKTKSSIQQSKIVTQGAGYRGNMVPVNIV